MTQNLISFAPTTTDLAAIDGALKTLEDKLIGLIDLSPTERHTLTKMGDKSEAFCRQAVEILGTNPNVLPPNFNVAEMRRDLAGFDTLRTRLIRIEKLTEKMRDSQLALGSDVMTAALEGYALLKVAGKGEALDTARKALSVRFSSRTVKKEPAPAQ
ncbi:hypothetical protein PI87_18700 [Ralstonia sp. A12]|uniref:hypothetical protein n=1 Tax=Ralstonia sp. A12 TaxID=1217052 RepID=UPI00057551FD|nr:hypothetical protein [Ralstonia sp. A12]KHK52831.1 hypothetical protein PI87_18700 [Ralstonia sp. A12]